MADHLYSDLIDLAQFPINDTNDPRYAALVGRYQHELDTNQYCVLHNFLTDAAISRAVDETEALIASGYRNTSTRNCYLQREPDLSLPSDHPRNIMFDASYTMLAADLFSASFSLKQLYYWPAMIQFVKDITQSAALYVSDDPYQPVNVLCSKVGDQSAWHFDSWNAFTMTLLLQAPQAGGEFQLVPNIRSQNNPNHAALSQVLQGDTGNMKTVSREPGSLVIFRGSTAVHRVTEVQGDIARLMGVFVYETEPGVIGDAQVNRTVYGPRVVKSAQS